MVEEVFFETVGRLLQAAAGGTDPSQLPDDVRRHANPEEHEAAGGVAKHIAETFKKFFILFKCSGLSIFFALAIRARYKKLGYWDMVSSMLMVDIFIMIGLFCFEFGNKYIFAYFTMISVLNYINFFGCNMLMRRLPTAEGAMLRAKTTPYFIFMHCMYLVVLILAFLPSPIGPFCTANALYPWAFTALESLLVVNAIAHHYMHYKKYWLKWEEAPEVKAVEGKEHENGFEPIPVIKPVFIG